jgi:hypothetical protein
VSIRFLADADLNQAIVIGVLGREAALDFLTATQAELEGRSDPEVLEFAASKGRILVSRDTSTMPVHFSDRLRSGQMSPGVFLVRRRASVGRSSRRSCWFDLSGPRFRRRGGGSMISRYWPGAEVATGVRDIPPPDTEVSTDTFV